jgi:hypothetical protein
MPWRSQGIEEDTKTWDKVIIDRKSDLKNWVDILREIVNDKKIRKMFAYANNHYAGFAPATVKLSSSHGTRGDEDGVPGL